MGNQNIGNRRAIIENTAGNTSAALSGLISSNYKGQLAMADAFRQAYDYNNT
jgi:cysteine synthase